MSGASVAVPIAVTGAGGFIGGAVCRALLASGRRVVALGPGSAPQHPALRHEPDRIDDRGSLVRALAGVELVIHAAGRGTPSAVDSLDGPVAMAEIRLAAQVLEGAAQAGVRKMVVVSSGGTVYGDPGSVAMIAESRPVQPNSRYGAVKAMVEQMALSLTRAGLLQCVVARVSNPYGPGQLNLRGQGLVATLVELLLRGQPVPVWGDGSVTRDYIYVDDVARGLLAAGGLPGGSVCNVSSGVGRSVAAVIRDVSAVVGQPARTETLPWRDGGVARNVLSNTLLMEETGWRPLVGWEEGLRQTVQWWRERPVPAAYAAQPALIQDQAPSVARRGTAAGAE